MTTEHWLTMIAIIATSITTLAAPILAEFVKSRMSHPSPTPDPNQPKKLIQRIGGWLMRFFQSLWWIVGWPLVFIPYIIYILLGEFRKTAPITRGDVLLISVSVTAIWSLFLNMTVSLMQQAISIQGESIRMQTVINDMLKNAINKVFNKPN